MTAADAGLRPGGRPRALVVGGGVAGACAALALRERGAGVVLVERERAGGSATRASAGMLAPQYEGGEASPLLGLGVECRARWWEWLDRLEAVSGVRVARGSGGMLVVNRDAAESEAAGSEASRQREAGLRAEVLAPREAARIEPRIAPGAHSWLWLPDEAWLDAAALADALAAALPRSGVVVREGREAVAVDSRGGRARGARLADGERIEADRVVVACGAWSGGLEGLPRRLPVRPLRGQILRFAAPGGAPGPLLADRDGRYLVPRAADALLAGSTMEEAGFEAVTTPAGRATIRRAASALLPELRGRRPAEAWAGLRPVAPDGLPILGADPGMEGLVYATAYGRNGILLGPLAGEAAAELALDRDPGPAWSRFRPDRFEAETG